MDLGERKQKILTAIIESYIQTGEPVGSKTLVERLDQSVSSATIRNEMAELASWGYLEQPHTSAGRIPTAKAFRLYIDQGGRGLRLRRGALRRAEDAGRRCRGSGTVDWRGLAGLGREHRMRGGLHHSLRAGKSDPPD